MHTLFVSVHLKARASSLLPWVLTLSQHAKKGKQHRGKSNQESSACPGGCNDLPASLSSCASPFLGSQLVTTHL